ncbi:MAG: hypothetical protein ACLFUS_02945 [Candidatus Sumerlaeia bacterium]
MPSRILEGGTFDRIGEIAAGLPSFFAEKGLTQAFRAYIFIRCLLYQVRLWPVADAPLGAEQ